MKTQFVPHKGANTFPGSSGDDKPDTVEDDDEQTQPVRAVSAPQKADPYQEPAYREHVTGNLVVHPSEAPNFRPAYQPYQPTVQQQGQGSPYPGPLPPSQPGNSNPYPSYPSYPSQQNYAGYQNYYPLNGQNGYASTQTPYAPYHGYPAYGYGYGYPPYGYQPYGYPYPYMLPSQPKRDGYLLGMSITSFVASILVFLSGIVSTFFLLIVAILPTTATVGAAQRFGGIVEFVAFSAAGLIGGSFAFYHSLRSLFLKKPSAEFKLPWFWIFFVLYLGVLLIAAAMRAHGQAVTNEPLSIFMISLAGILPSLTIVALGVRRIHFPRNAPWPTTWRRFAVALISGATLAILLALIFELILTVVLQKSLGVTVSLDNPDQQIPQDPKAILFLFLLVSVVAPLVEEGVKPLAVVIMIGRIRSAGEAFILGLACGTGFNLIETTGYMGMGYNNWLSTAIERTSSGLLHGFGAAMVSLGYYYLTHPKETRHRFLIPLSCWGYAVLQHAIWNGSFGLQLLPAPIGPYLDNGTVPLGPLSFPAVMLVYGGLTILMLTFFLYMTRKVRPGNSPFQPKTVRPTSEPFRELAAPRT
ncbi:MAG: PrsW family intramembrane metalloprotease [Ktedonobacteraceae bacterium]|nr:PrsW family intramembrane metalloprotease [Ktedonobacteraceae bacterium]